MPQAWKHQSHSGKRFQSRSSGASARIKIAVLGAGNMGTAMAHALAGNGHDVTVWDHFPEVGEDVRAAARPAGRTTPD
jgi:NADPH-dependent glutamate synthase beta subunit-like oxidoreductase